MLVKDIISCGKGWEKLYNPIIESILKYDNKKLYYTDKIGIKSISNKSGRLRIDLYNILNAPSSLLDEIDNAERLSESTCSFCGTRENIGMTYNNNVVTCCEKCWREQIKSTNEKSLWVKTKKY